MTSEYFLTTRLGYAVIFDWLHILQHQQEHFKARCSVFQCRL